MGSNSKVQILVGSDVANVSLNQTQPHLIAVVGCRHFQPYFCREWKPSSSADADLNNTANYDVAWAKVAANIRIGR